VQKRNRNDRQKIGRHRSAGLSSSFTATG
jgi:hypothetical protein